MRFFKTLQKRCLSVLQSFRVPKHAQTWFFDHLKASRVTNTFLCDLHITLGLIDVLQDQYIGLRGNHYFTKFPSQCSAHRKGYFSREKISASVSPELLFNVLNFLKISIFFSKKSILCFPSIYGITIILIESHD